METNCWLKVAGSLLVSAMALAQTNQPSNQSQMTSQASSSQAAAAQPNDKGPSKPLTVVDAANAAKQKAASQPPAKIYRNKDVRDPAEASTTANAMALTPASAQNETAPSLPLQTPADFKAQGDTYKNQILIEKEKLADIKNHVADLKFQLDAWAASFDSWAATYPQYPADASICWTPPYNAPYPNDWCDTGRSLKVQYDAAQKQLKKEKSALEKMQEDIRRKGYGNGVYDPDLP
jgi:hypothetical protein